MEPIIKIICGKRAIIILLCISFVLGISNTMEAKHNKGGRWNNKRYLFRPSFNDNKKHKGRICTGINVVAIQSQLKKSNGITWGILAAKDSVQNGITMAGAVMTQKQNGVALSPLYIDAGQVNGLALSPLISVVDKMNGVNISYAAGGYRINGLAIGVNIFAKRIQGVGISYKAQEADTSKGVFISVGGFTDWRTKKERSRRMIRHTYLSGVAIGCAFSDIENVKGLVITAWNNSLKQKGVSIGLINTTKRLRGVQIGLLNYARNNPKGLRLMPFVNVHLKKH